MKQKRFFLLSCVMLAGLAALLGCEGTKVASFISVTPSTANVMPEGTQQFSAAIRNSANPNNVRFNVDRGMIDQNGLYTAAGVPNGTTATVTVSARDGSAPPATATVNVVSSIKIDQGPQSVSVGSRTVQFTAKIDGKAADNALIDWSSTSNRISASGLYTSPPSSANVIDGTTETVTAKIKGTTVQDSIVVTLKSANVSIPVQ